MNIYTVQDLASYNRVVPLKNGHAIKFTGHYATVTEDDIEYFNRIDDFQVSAPRKGETPTVSPPAKVLPIKPLPGKTKPVLSTQDPAREYAPTSSPNIKNIAGTISTRTPNK